MEGKGKGKELFELAMKYYYGLGNEEGINHSKSIQLLNESFNQYGYTPSAIYLALCYKHGRGVTENEEETERLCLEAIKMGFSVDENCYEIEHEVWERICVSFLYDWGFGVPKKLREIV